MEAVYFRTSYWDDNFIDGLSLKDNHLYFYLITNRHINPSGIYKLNFSECILKSKIKKEEILKILNTSLKDKIYFFGEWIFIKNFLRKTFRLPKKELSGNIKTAIKNQFLVDKPPVEVISCFYNEYDYVEIDYPYPMDTLSEYIKALGFRFEDLGIRFDNNTSCPEPEKTVSEPSDHKKFITYAHDTFKSQYNYPLKIDGAKDGKLIKSLLGTYGIDTLRSLWDKFLVSDDEFICKAGKSISVFSSQINKLISGGAGRQLTKDQQRLFNNAAAAKAWVEGK